MSGRKRGYIRPNFRGALRSACADATRGSLQESPQLAVDELEKQLKEARRQCREARQTAEKQTVSPRTTELLDRMDARREDLVLLLTEEQRKLERAITTRRTLEQEVKSASLAAADGNVFESQLGAALARLNKASSEDALASSAAQPARKKFERGLRELQLWREEVQRELLPHSVPVSGRQVAPEESLKSVQERLAHQAELAALKEEFRILEMEPDGGWDEVRRWVKSRDVVEESQRLMSTARSHLNAGDLNAARSAVEQAESHRAAAITETERNRRDTERTQQIADAIMQALCDRKYDTPKFGFLKEGDPLSGIQVRADVPNRDGRGNIRIDIHLDGRTEIDVENIDEGEEESCRDSLGGLTEALAHEGLQLDITDWGRAKEAQSSVDQELKIPVRERESERERERGR